MNIGKFAPQILTALGIVGMISTVVMAIKATPKCDELIAEAEERLREETEDNSAELGKKETVTCALKAYWPTISMGIVSAGCFIVSNYVYGKREAVVATALGMSEVALHRFQEATLETVGKKTMDEIRGRVADRQLQESKVDLSTEESRNRNIVLTKHGTTLFYDPYIDRHFRSDLEYVRRCVNDLNEDALSGDFVSLNDLYFALDLKECKRGENLGWHPYNGGEKIELDYSARITEWGEPCIVLDYTVEPAEYARDFI